MTMLSEFDSAFIENHREVSSKRGTPRRRMETEGKTKVVSVWG